MLYQMRLFPYFVVIFSFLHFSTSHAEEATKQKTTEAPKTQSEAPLQKPQQSSGASVSKKTSSQEKISFYGGMQGFINGSFLQSSKSDFYTDQNGNSFYTGGSVPTPLWGGVGGGAGANFGVRWKALSFDFGYEHSVDQAEGKINGFTYTIEQTTRHIPLTLRAEMLNETVRPSIFAGVDFVSITQSSVKTPPLGSSIDTTYSDYMAWRFGLGFEVIVNEQLRIPFRLLANFAPRDRDNLDDVLVLNQGNPSISYRSEWVWQPQISLGFVYDFYTLQ